MLLLRLRQACCHPHLIKDFEKVQDGEEAQGSAGGKDRVKKLLDGLVASVRDRLLERGMDAVECPICMDIGEESVILSKCGHIYCRACITGKGRYFEETKDKGLDDVSKLTLYVPCHI